MNKWEEAFEAWSKMFGLRWQYRGPAESAFRAGWEARGAADAKPTVRAKWVPLHGEAASRRVEEYRPESPR